MPGLLKRNARVIRVPSAYAGIVQGAFILYFSGKLAFRCVEREQMELQATKRGPLGL